MKIKVISFLITSVLLHEFYKKWDGNPEFNVPGGYHL